MWGAVILALVVAGLWLWLKSLGPKAPAGSVIVKSPTTHTASSSGGAVDVQILFGTQTGTAQGFAKTLYRDAQRLKLKAAICDLEEYSPRKLADERVVIFVVSTYGEGEPPDPMKPFYDWLTTEATRSDVENVKYAVFGLGDRQYKFFSQMGVVLDTRFAELGAERIVGCGSGDAGQRMEEEFDAWRQDLWPCVGGALGVKLDGDNEEPVTPELTLKKWDAEDATKTPFIEAAPMMEPTQVQPVYAVVEVNRELLNGCAPRSTRLITFSTSGSSLSYQSGDHLGILPCNSDDMVHEYLVALNAEKDADTVISIADQNGRNQLPTRQTLRVAMKWFLDLSGVPKKSVLRAFAHYCTDAAEKEQFLAALRTTDAALATYHKLQARLRTTLGFLRHFTSCKVPLGHFLELMPRMAPRFFSISSDQLLHPGSVSVTVALVDGGVATTMLCGAEVGSRVALFVRKSKFHLPLRDKQRPVIMIGPGTGVAPMVGFLERRQAWLAKGNALGPAMLFFGCRNKDKDFIHGEYLRQCEKDGALTVLDVAFSRDAQEKVYVQHRLSQRAGEVWGLIQGGANVYICGDAKNMAKDVERTLLEKVFQGAGKMSADAAVQYLQDLVKLDRYHKDVWSA
jgi:NADPH-ferrihemoprotein reductase